MTSENDAMEPEHHKYQTLLLQYYAYDAYTTDSMTGAKVTVGFVNMAAPVLYMISAMLVTHESGRVVVSHGLGVTEGLQDRVGLDHLVLEVTLRSKVSQRLVRGLLEVSQGQSEVNQRPGRAGGQTDDRERCYRY